VCRHIFICVFSLIVCLVGLKAWTKTLGIAQYIIQKTQQKDKLPIRAQKLMESLPQKAVTLGVIVGRAAKVSDAFQAIMAQKSQINVPALKAQSRLGTNIFSNYNYGKDETEPRSLFSPTQSVISTGTFGVNHNFPTGTSLNAEVTHGKTEIEFSTVPRNEFNETTGQISLTQELLKDGFGYATQKGLKSGQMTKKATGLLLEENIEQWVLQMVDLFYLAWLAQSKVAASDLGLQRRKKLLKVTQVKFKRGTAEKPDLFQVQSAVMQSEVELAMSRQELQDIWRRLAIALKFPSSWLEIDALHIPMELDQPLEGAQKRCQGVIPHNSVSIQKRQAESQASKLQLAAARNLLRPSLQLQGAWKVNGIDQDKSETWKETFEGKHPAWTMAVNLNIPLENYSQKAELLTAISQKDRTGALLSKAMGDQKVDWINQCTNLSRLIESKKLTLLTRKKQFERARLEEKRFVLGRTAVLNVIQAGDDATQADFRLRQVEIDLRKVSWKIRQMANVVIDFLKYTRQINLKALEITNEKTD